MISVILIRTGLIFLAIFSFGNSAVGQSQEAVRSRNLVKIEFFRTELYFGRSKTDQTIVSLEEWNQFLAEVVTPRFPDGFSVLKAIGQYREKSGKIISEPSEVIVFLYSRKTRNESRTKIEEIRAAYLKQFSQESVLRVDFPKSLHVSF